jgi:phage terminase large subunit
VTAPVTAARLDRLGRGVEALLEEHADGARPRDPALARHAGDPVAFIETVTGGWLWEKPRAIIAALRDHRKVAVRACHGASKDWTAARIALWWVFALGGRVICSAPSMHQLVDILFDTEFRGAFNGATPKLAGKLWTTKLKIDGEPHAGIIGMVSTRDAKLTGLHAPRTLVLITEANGIEGWAVDALESNALDPDDRVLAIGNPLASAESWFRAAFAPGSTWHALHIAAADVFAAGINVLGGRRVPGMITPEWVAEKKREWGEASPRYQAKVLGEFPDGRDDAVATRAWLERAATLHEARTLLDRKAPHGLACDVGREGDPSALCWSQGYHVHEVLARPTPTGDAVADWVVERAVEIAAADRVAGYGAVPPDTVVLDVVGVGASPADAFARTAAVVVEYRGNARASDPVTFENVRAESFNAVRTLLERGALALPRDAELWAELLAVRLFVNARGRIQAIDKDEVRDELGRSPNKADAVAMAVHEVECGASGGGVRAEDTWIF